MKHTLILTEFFFISFLLFCSIPENKKNGGQISNSKLLKNHSIKVIPEYDTIYNDNIVKLILSFTINNSNINIIGDYKNDDSLSFIDPLHYIGMSININDSSANSYNGSNFTWDRYFELFDSVVYVNNKKGEFVILNGRPMFCNGFYCSNISSLVIKLNNPKKYTIINTEFCDDDSLVYFIHINNNPNDSTLQLPVFSDECTSKNRKMKIIHLQD